jgi:hypothetical protein
MCFYNQNNINTNIFSVFLMFKQIIQKIDLTKIYKKKKKQKKKLITEMYHQSEIWKILAFSIMLLIAYLYFIVNCSSHLKISSFLHYINMFCSYLNSICSKICYLVQIKDWSSIQHVLFNANKAWFYILPLKH